MAGMGLPYRQSGAAGSRSCAVSEVGSEPKLPTAMIEILAVAAWADSTRPALRRRLRDLSAVRGGSNISRHGNAVFGRDGGLLLIAGQQKSERSL